MELAFSLPLQSITNMQDWLPQALLFDELFSSKDLVQHLLLMSFKPNHVCFYIMFSNYLNLGVV